MKPKELRRLSSMGEFDHHTAGYCEGYVQANLVVLPKIYSDDFKQFCIQNPKPCPVLEIVGPDNFVTQKIADHANLLNTIPRYLIWRQGKIVSQEQSIDQYYSKNFVFFLLGCSFSFEQALIENGISLRHVERNKNVAMYDTDIELTPCGPFFGNMVVSMRPIHKSLVPKACLITGKYPDVHGEPVHIGYPEMIGIKDIQTPDYGDYVEIKADEIPVFWACGVTPQNVLVQAKLEFAITHAPGFMFVGDRLNTDFQK